jgi:hypothetical protein
VYLNGEGWRPSAPKATGRALPSEKESQRGPSSETGKSVLPDELNQIIACYGSVGSFMANLAPRPFAALAGIRHKKDATLTGVWHG